MFWVELSCHGILGGVNMDVLNVVSTIISVISLAAILFQSIILKKTIDNQIYSSFVANSVELDKVLINYPHIRKYIYDNKPITERTENLDQIMSVIELAIDITENIEVYKKYIPKSRREGWMRFVKDIESTSAYKYYMKKYGAWFNKD